MLRFKLISFVIIFAGTLSAQTCGFGCLGMSGVYGGYTRQDYDASELNSIIQQKAKLVLNQQGFESSGGFEKSENFRIGANIFRAIFDEYFLTVKGFYQFNNEEVIFTGNNSRSVAYNLELNYWGLGFDFGVPIMRNIDLKILEGGLNFFQVDFEEIYPESGNLITNKYDNGGIDVGYYVGSGIVIHIIPDYLSIEGTVYYNFFKIENLIDENGNNIASNLIDQKLIQNNNISGTLQLNIGFPL